MSAQADTDTNAPMILTVSLVGAILLLVIVLALEAVFRQVEETEWDRKVVDVRWAELRETQVRQREALRGYRWVDQGKGVVAIPIERAMELTVRDASRAAAPTEPRP